MRFFSLLVVITCWSGLGGAKTMFFAEVEKHCKQDVDHIIGHLGVSDKNGKVGLDLSKLSVELNGEISSECREALNSEDLFFGFNGRMFSANLMLGWFFATSKVAMRRISPSLKMHYKFLKRQYARSRNGFVDVSEVLRSHLNVLNFLEFFKLETDS